MQALAAVALTPRPLVPRLYALVLVAIVLEIGWYLLVRKRAYPWREMLATAGTYALRLPVKALYGVVLVPVAAAAWSLRLWTIPLDTAWGLLLLFVATEFCYYWAHRGGHRIRWMWASHAVHHTPEELHLASAFRLGVTDLVSGGWLFYVPLYVLGFQPLAVAAMLGVNLFFQFWLHTELVGRLGPLEWLLNTPSQHRVHHARNPAYLDRNFGGVLMVFDRLFGTHAVERPDVTIAYGLVHPVGSHNPLTLAFHQWTALARDVRRAPSWRERFRQAFGPPGEPLPGPVTS
jgi:sterol desaturase/sphingolipid hydroxylase (fatty acid hydroxylase superfamily)